MLSSPLSVQPPSTAPVSVPVAIVLGLFSSFVQSLGLTIQRKSHLQNASLPPLSRRTDWKRPLWVVGFVIFLVANVGGTVFQIGALPIVMLAPLGAVSLLYNALLARFILDDFLSRYMVAGTILIALGAVLIGYFGAVQEPPHDLDDLLALYARPPFVAFATIFVLIILGVLALAHLAEWQLHIRLFRPPTPLGGRQKKGKGFASRNGKRSSSGSSTRGRLTRRWSAPSLAPVVEVSESSSGIATPVLEIADEANRRGLPVERVLLHRGKSPKANDTTRHQARSNTVSGGVKKSYGSIPRHASPESPSSRSATPIDYSDNHHSTSAAALLVSSHDPVVRRTCLGLAVAYGGISGTLSGACLLLAKSGVELLVLTIAGPNQFARWQSWALVGIMNVAAVLQLWYLNKSLRLADPTLVCPLAFCFYNTSSIALGLVYFNQLGALAPVSLCLVILGTAVLLAGVWIVSMHGRAAGDEDDDQVVEEAGQTPDASVVTVSTSSHLSRPRGPANIENPTETEALLASNAAGIAGPHLPPPTSTPLDPAESEGLKVQTSPEGETQLVASPSNLSPSPPTSPSGRKRRRGSGSGTSLMGGLGLHVPGLPGSSDSPLIESPEDQQNATHDSRDNDGSSSSRLRTLDASERSLLRGAGPSRTVSAAYKRSRDLYRAVLERGLSIGISPSSPGFHIPASFSDDEVRHIDSLEQQTGGFLERRRGARRTFSEADAENVSRETPIPRQSGSDGGDAEEEEDDAESLGTRTSWSRVMPEMDFKALSDKLVKLKSEAGGWLRWRSQSGIDEEDDERRSLLSEEGQNVAST